MTTMGRRSRRSCVRVYHTWVGHADLFAIGYDYLYLGISRFLPGRAYAMSSDGTSNAGGCVMCGGCGIEILPEMMHDNNIILLPRRCPINKTNDVVCLVLTHHTPRTQHRL